MDLSFYFDKYYFNEGEAIKYGFVKTSDGFTYEVSLGNGDFKGVFSISKDSFKVVVYDLELDEEYFPFEVKANKTGFVKALRFEVDEVLKDVILKCFIPNRLRDKIIDYCLSKYKATVDYPWDNLDSPVIRNEYGKWFGLIMRLKSSFFGIKEEYLVDGINLKVDGKKIDSIIDNVNIFKGFHMSKKNWITVKLDNSTDLKNLYELIEESYNLSKLDNKKEIHNWIIPANPKFYDVDKDLVNNDTILWKQSSKVHVGDLVYLYFGSPESRIKYRFTITKIDIAYNYEDSNLEMHKAMELKLLNKYLDINISLDVLKEYNVTTIRGPREMPSPLIEYIDKISNK